MGEEELARTIALHSPALGQVGISRPKCAGSSTNENYLNDDDHIYYKTGRTSIAATESETARLNDEACGSKMLSTAKRAH